MSDYTKTTNFASKDSLPSGNSDKIVKGTEIDTEFNNIQTAVATKLNVNDSTLTGTTTFGSLSDGTITITAFVDEDNMASDSATLLPTQQSVKAYVDSQVTAQDLDFQADSGGALSIDLDSETLTFTGGTGVDTSGAGNAVTFSIDSTVATLTGTQTLTNKTLTSPVLNTGVSGSAVLDEDNMASDSATHLATQQSIKAYVDSNVTAQDLDVTDGSSTIDIDLDSESLGILGGTGIDSTASGTGVTLAIDSTVTTLAGTQTLTNKTLTSPTLNTPTIGTSFTIGSATITEAELEILDGATVTTDELNVLDGVTSTTAELNILDGVTSTAAELNILDGVTSTTAELNILDGVTSTTAELNILDGVTATTTELNYVDGVTSAIQTQIDAKAALAGANFTGDVDVAGTLTTDSFSIEDATSPTLTLNDTTSANQKTTLSHTVGASVLTTGDNGVFGSFKVAAFDGTSTINRLLIADNGDVSLYEDGGVTAKVTWDSSEEALEFDDNVKATFGAGSDLQIYHDSTTGHSYIKESGSGDLILQAGNDLRLEDPSGNEYLRGNEGAGVDIAYNNATKLATTSTGIDVTGTVTADGLTVDGAVAINTNNVVHTALTPSYSFIESDVTGENTQFLQASGTLRIRTVDGSLANPVERLRIDHGTGDISFYNSSGTSQSLFWDSSAEALGIGTTSPAKTLQVSQGTDATATTIRIENTDTTIDAAQTANAIEFYTNDASTGGTGVTGKISHVAVNAGSTYALAFSSYSGSSLSEAMRIDASGNLLVGKTSADNTTAGTTIYGAIAQGAASFVRDAGNTLVLNRLTSDGEILALRKDGSTVGSIGVKNSDLTVGTGNTGLRFTDSTNQIWAVDTTDGSSRDAAVDLGNSTVRFRDLYLSGTVTAGGLTLGAEGDQIIIPTSNGGINGIITTGDDVYGNAFEFKNGNAIVLISDTNDTAVTGGIDATLIARGSSVTRTALFDVNGDVSFYEDTGTTPKFFWDASAESLGIGTSSPNHKLEIRNDVAASADLDPTAIKLYNNNDGGSAIEFSNGVAAKSKISFGVTSTGAGTNDSYLSFSTGADAGLSEAMRIDSSGNLLVGKTSAAISSDGVEARNNGLLVATRDNNQVAILNRRSSDGDILAIYKSGISVGSIGVRSSTNLYIAFRTEANGDGCGLTGSAASTGAIIASDGDGDPVDNHIDLGASGTRFDDIYATNGTINTSDRNEKQDIEALSDAEQRVAVAAKGLLRKFRWINSVETKGDDARIHFGIIAQDLQDAFTAEGLDAGRYAMFISSTWTDEETGEERTRLGVRYSELLAFIIAAI